MTQNVAEIRRSIESVLDPEIGRSLGDLRMLSRCELRGQIPVVEIELPTPAYPRPERIGAAIQARLNERFPGLSPAEFRYGFVVRGHEAGGKIGLKIKNIIAVGSGKGGVGKSTVAAGLAYGLHHFGAKVGLMDADVYGPSIPHLVGATGRPAAREIQGSDGQTLTRIEPVDAHGVKCISMAFFVEPEKAIIWRGPLLHRAITQFLKDTDWGELDYLVIDMPPGTGDVSLTLSQSVGLAGAVVVCTPQQVALLDAVKAVSMFRQVNIPLLGMVENMTGEIFGRGGAKAKAAELGIPFLGEIPIEAGIRIEGDAGRIWALLEEGHPSRDAILNVSQQVAMQIARQLLETPRMPSLEIL